MSFHQVEMTILKVLVLFAVLISAVQASHYQMDIVRPCYPNQDCSIVLCAAISASDCASGELVLCGCCEACKIILPVSAPCDSYEIPTNEVCEAGSSCQDHVCTSDGYCQQQSQR